LTDYGILADYGKYVEASPKNRTFHEEMGAILKEKRWNAETFKERTGLDDMTYSRLMTKPHYKFSKRVIVNIGLGLELDVWSVKRLLALQGHIMTCDDDVDKAYSYILERGYTDFIFCNKVLTVLKIPIVHHFGTRSKM
jgi:hypothetical protein